MPTLLLICEYPTLNGGERSMLSTLEGICEAGFRAVVAAPDQGPLAEALRAKGVEQVPFRIRDDSGNHLPSAQCRADLATIIEHLRPGLLHANSLAMGRLSGPVARQFGLPSLAHLRDIVRLSPQAVADLNCHTRLLAVSQATRDFHVAGGLAADKTHVLYNGVDLGKYCPRAPSGWLHRELGLPAAAPLLATIGQISLRKGQDVLVAAAAEVVRTFPEAHYLIVGQRFSEKEESVRFEAELHSAAEREVPGRFHFLGIRDDMPQLLNEVTLLVHPARQEPLGRVLLEAAAAGVAVVATDVGGTREILPPDSSTAMLVPAGDSRTLAAAICELLSDDQRRRTVAAAARKRAEDFFDVRRATAGLVEHYRAVLGLSMLPPPGSEYRQSARDSA